MGISVLCGDDVVSIHTRDRRDHRSGTDGSDDHVRFHLLCLLRRQLGIHQHFDAGFPDAADLVFNIFVKVEFKRYFLFAEEDAAQLVALLNECYRMAALCSG